MKSYYKITRNASVLHKSLLNYSYLNLSIRISSTLPAIITTD
ncbi:MULTISPECIES: hypothetical protein [Helicobacter]|nr:MULTISPECIES: hypothetical protein [Helicobacter]